MKTKYILIVSLILMIVSFADGQYVSIPDANLRSYLQTNYSSCFNGNLLDTNCAKSQAPVVFTFDLSNKNITDLTGLKYFQNLKKLYCRNDNLTALAPLPANLKELYCDSNQISSLPDLPSGLQILWAIKNRLSTLPTIPSSLQTLYIDNNLFTSLPDLVNVSSLACSNNQLTSLPSIANLVGLSCNNNQINSLSALPTFMSVLYCSGNQLTSLPLLPSDLTKLECSNNQLTSLPDLPTHIFHTLWCDNNLLDCLPVLPNSLYDLKAAGNNIVCLPNIPTDPTFTSDIGTTVCNSSNNVHNCPVATGIMENKAMEKDINLYPNPGRGNINISSSIQQYSMAIVKILSPQGMEIYNAETWDLNSLEIDLSKEHKGIYYLQIILNDSIANKKIVIE